MIARTTRKEVAIALAGAPRAGSAESPTYHLAQPTVRGSGETGIAGGPHGREFSWGGRQVPPSRQEELCG